MTDTVCSTGVPKGPLLKRPANPHSQWALNGVPKGDLGLSRILYQGVRPLSYAFAEPIISELARMETDTPRAQMNAMNWLSERIRREVVSRQG